MVVKLVSVLLFLFSVAELFYEGQAQMVKQCLCSQTEPCANKYMGALEPCIESCQHHLQALGGNFGALKQCFKSKQNLIQSAIQCTQGQNKNA
uniref:Cys-rich protein n=1 Tax=Meloidogyne hapla TaxID=6305 RepID=A0A1I8BPT1_MELHA